MQSEPKFLAPRVQRRHCIHISLRCRRGTGVGRMRGVSTDRKGNPPSVDIKHRRTASRDKKLPLRPMQMSFEDRFHRSVTADDKRGQPGCLIRLPPACPDDGHRPGAGTDILEGVEPRVAFG